MFSCDSHCTKVPYIVDGLISTYRSLSFLAYFFFSLGSFLFGLRNDYISLIFIYSTSPLLLLRRKSIHQGYLFLAFEGYDREAGIQSQHLLEKSRYSDFSAC